MQPSYMQMDPTLISKQHAGVNGRLFTLLFNAAALRANGNKLG